MVDVRGENLPSFHHSDLRQTVLSMLKPNRIISVTFTLLQFSHL